MWEQKGKPSADTESSDEGEVEDDIEPGAIFLCKSVMRKVLLRPDKTVVKSGPFISLGEAEALKVAPGAGLPVPSLYGVSSTNGTVEIRMSYIQGQTLEELWPSMSGEQRKNVAGQLHEIVKRMRELEPPPDCIGCCDGTGIRDTRVRFTYHGPICTSEAQFNAYFWIHRSSDRYRPHCVRRSVLSSEPTTGSFLLMEISRQEIS
ncbi:hypothetical protein V2A60_010389 [Cordyceps javanica]